METKEYRTIDKSEWGEGEWQHEPDKRQWADADTGLPCLIIRNSTGALCGYVGVPTSHPLHGIGYNKPAPLPRSIIRACLVSKDILSLYEQELEAGTVEVESILPAHGGITFSGDCQKGDEATSICHVPDAGEPDNLWWFGFDCSHAWDLSPKLSSFLYRNRIRVEPDRSETYRSFPFVAVECRTLASTLKALQSPNTLLRIDAIWAFVSVDAEGHEGVCACPMPGMSFPMPMIAADEARLKSLIPVAELLAKVANMRIRLIKLTTREEVKVFDSRDD